MQVIKIGTRESRLAVVQAEVLAAYIRRFCKGKEAELVTMKTTGDKILDRTLDKVGGKGLFVKELDSALRKGSTDISVHSLKDVPMEVAGDLPILGVSAREDARDALVLPLGEAELNFAQPLGTSSPRRAMQLGRLFPQMEIKSVRGNVQTRLAKLDRGEYSGLVLAAAGLKRLGLEERISRYFTVEEMIPAAGQGILAIQGRQGEDYGYLEGFFDEKAAYCAAAERSFVRALGGGCSSPIAAYAKIVPAGNGTGAENSGGEEVLTLTGLYAREDGWEYKTASAAGKKEEAERLGEALAREIRFAMQSRGN